MRRIKDLFKGSPIYKSILFLALQIFFYFFCAITLLAIVKIMGYKLK